LEVNFPQGNINVLLEDLLANIKRNVPLVRKMPKKKEKEIEEKKMEERNDHGKYERF